MGKKKSDKNEQNDDTTSYYFIGSCDVSLIVTSARRTSSHSALSKENSLITHMGSTARGFARFTRVLPDEIRSFIRSFIFSFSCSITIETIIETLANKYLERKN